MDPDAVAPSARVARDAYRQVLRLAEFRRAHPQVRVEHRAAPLWHWAAEWTDDTGATQLVTRPALGELLDQLVLLAGAEQDGTSGWPAR